ncbi:MAG TPA: hypothetical protein VNT81_22785, partial [Vicinamibacterales bacterium]|nr:hypothetical protein [Vicinamibacterales bacterium]
MTDTLNPSTARLMRAAIGAVFATTLLFAAPHTVLAQSATAAQMAVAMDIPQASLVNAEVIAPVLEGTRNVRSSFGSVTPQSGTSLAIMSNGRAASPVDPGYSENFDHQLISTYPIGYPQESALCPGVVTGSARDLTHVAVTLQVPAAVNGLAFDFNYYSRDYPSWVCSQFGDGFAAILERGGTLTSISVDANGQPTVSNAV